MKHYLTLLAITVMTIPSLCSCLQESGYDGNEQNQTNITFSPTEDNDRTVTRASLVTGAGITSFGVSAAAFPAAGSYAAAGCGSYFYNIQASPNVATAYYWPTSDYRMAFYAYYPYGNAAFTMTSSANTTGIPTYNYTVPTDIANQQDVMTAQHTNVNPSAQSTFALMFQHDCAAIAFSISNEQAQAVNIKKVSIEGVKYSGTLNNHTWTLSNSLNSSTTNPFVLTLNRNVTAGATDVDLTGSSNILLMLPQTLLTGAKIILETDDETYEAEIDGTWSAGFRYNYHITLTPSIIIPELTITDWQLQEMDADLTINDWEPKYPPEYKTRYLTFTALENTTFSFSKAGLSYSTDYGVTWNELAANASTPTIAAGKTVIWKNNQTLAPVTSEGIGTFSSTGRYTASGNVMSLLYGDDFINKKSLTGYNYAFYKLFSSSIKLRSAGNLILPATTLANYCYQYMFQNCISLTTAPELPATTLAPYCYYYMFGGCASLTTAPELPATTLANSCYENMFSDCTALTTAPELPAETLANYCYQYMFGGCSSLTTAPELPAETLANNCYQYMFGGCSSLTTAPELPATTLVYHCYEKMFYGCRALTYIKAAFTTTPSSSYTKNWVYNVASSGTFYKNSAATWNVTGTSGVPSGWTVETYTP